MDILGVPMPTPATFGANPHHPVGGTCSDRRADQCTQGHRLGVESNPYVRWPSSRRSSSSRASEVFSEHLAERRHVHHRLRQKLLQPSVLVLKSLQPLGFRYLHLAILRTPLVKRRVADAVFAAQIRGRKPRLVLLQNPNDICSSENLDRLIACLLLQGTG